MTDWNGDWLDDQDGEVLDDDRWNTDWFGDDPDGNIPPIGPAAVGDLALVIENGVTITYRYGTGIIKTASGKEQRNDTNDHPAESYSGRVILIGEHAVDVRLQLASFAAKGEALSLGMQHEEVMLSADATDGSCPIEPDELALLDWKNPGQRVLLVGEDENGEIRSMPATIQAETSGALVLDSGGQSFGLGKYGDRIMPVMPVLLEPQQNFQRMEVDAEVWNIQARAAVFDFARKLGSLALGPYTTHAGLADATITERYPGAADSFRMTGFGLDGLGDLDETTADVWFNFASGGFLITTIDDLHNWLLSSTRLVATGTWVLGGGNMTVGDEMDQPLVGGTVAGPLGTGATLTEYAGKPVWDWPIEIDGQITDSIHAMTQMIDHGGIPLAIGTADMADWGRGIAFSSPDREDFQWLKLFLATIAGCQKSFWLPTWRDDLPFVSKAANTITVRAGKLTVLWPKQRKHIQIWETNETITYAEIAAAVYDTVTGTWTLTIGTTIATSSVRKVSWLECCRFEKDEFPVVCDEHGRHMAVTARVVQG